MAPKGGEKRKKEAERAPVLQRPAAPPPAKSVLDAQTSYDEAEDGFAEEGRADGGAPAAEPTAPAELAEWLGRVLLAIGREWVVEIACQSAFAWDPAQPLTLTLEDGTTLTLTPDATKSTRAGWIEAGTVIRISVELPEGVAARPSAVVLAGLPGIRVRIG
jgi:hypothetical protein